MKIKMKFTGKKWGHENPYECEVLVKSICFPNGEEQPITNLPGWEVELVEPEPKTIEVLREIVKHVPTPATLVDVLGAIPSRVTMEFWGHKHD